MNTTKGNSLNETRRLNRILIKNYIFRMGVTTRADIARSLDLTLPTITTSVNEMIRERLLEEVPLPEEKQAPGESLLAFHSLKVLLYLSALNLVLMRPEPYFQTYMVIFYTIPKKRLQVKITKHYSEN